MAFISLVSLEYGSQKIYFLKVLATFLTSYAMRESRI